jgi:hypothetical protein
VTIANRTAAYSRTYCLGRWSLNSKSVKPMRKTTTGLMER